MVLVSSTPDGRPVDPGWIRQASWVLREKGSGTRSTFEQTLRAMRIDTLDLHTALVLPSNEAVLTAVAAGAGVAVLSTFVVAAAIAAGTLHALPLRIPPRPFFGLRHKERYRTRAADTLLAMIQASIGDEGCCRAG
jgi:DNA-binding transcriptional LysR family regulator